MKEIIKSLFFILIFTFLALVASSVVSSQELSIKEATESSIVDNAEKRVEYQLPYPGLLPDSPLYFLKALRDAIVDFLISDPLKKADFYLLAADKRLNAGAYLVKNKNKYELAESAISKGENYFEKAITKAKEAKKQGMDIGGIRSRLLLSSQKHQEIINDLMENADSKTKGKFSALFKRAEKYEKEVNLLTTN